MESKVIFSARLISFSAVTEYRVYAKDSDFFFIEIPGMSKVSESMAIHFGLIGLLIRNSMRKKAKAKADLLFQTEGNQDPQHLIGNSKNNFQVHIPEIRDSSLTPPTFFAFHGNQAGRWEFVMRDGKKRKFEIESLDDMKSAVNTLPRFLSGTLRIHVEWNESKKKFQKTNSHH